MPPAATHGPVLTWSAGASTRSCLPGHRMTASIPESRLPRRSPCAHLQECVVIMYHENIFPLRERWAGWALTPT